MSKKSIAVIIGIFGVSLLFLSCAFLLRQTLSSRVTPVSTMPAGDTEGDFYASDGARLHYWFYNRGTPTVTIFLHGGPGGSTSDFRRTGQAQAYADTFGSLLAFDQRGGGQSEKSADLAPSISYDRFIQDINELRDAITPGHDVVLFGRSFGGPLAVRYANSQPDGVKGYILAAPGPFTSQNDVLEQQRRVLLASTDEPERATVAAAERAAVLQLVEDRGTREPEAKLVLPDEDDGLDVGEAFRASGDYLAEDEYHRLSALAHVPTLVVYGSYDIQVPPLSIEAMRPYLPNAMFLELPGGHGVAYTHESEFFEAVKALFEQMQ